MTKARVTISPAFKSEMHKWIETIEDVFGFPTSTKQHLIEVLEQPQAVWHRSQHLKLPGGSTLREAWIAINPTLAINDDTRLPTRTELQNAIRWAVTIARVTS